MRKSKPVHSMWKYFTKFFGINWQDIFFKCKSEKNRKIRIKIQWLCWQPKYKHYPCCQGGARLGMRQEKEVGVRVIVVFLLKAINSQANKVSFKQFITWIFPWRWVHQTPRPFTKF